MAERFQPHCPIRGLDVHEGVTDHIISGSPPTLSVGVVHTDQSVEKQAKLLKEIQDEVLNTCRECVDLDNNDGDCTPGTFFRGGLVSTVIVGDRNELPNKVKTKKYYYKHPS